MFIHKVISLYYIAIIIFNIILTFIFLLMIPAFRLYIINIILSITESKHPQPDGCRIYITGSTLKRKLSIHVESLMEKYLGVIPAGSYCRYLNYMHITKYSLGTDTGIDTYGTPEVVKTVANIISHEFMHMILYIEHGSKASVAFDNLCLHSESISNSGMDD